jgi:hypothetical protein
MDEYVLSDNHASRQIDLMQGNSRGAVLHSFDNSTPIADIVNRFERLQVSISRLGRRRGNGWKLRCDGGGGRAERVQRKHYLLLPRERFRACDTGR